MKKIAYLTVCLPFLFVACSQAQVSLTMAQHDQPSSVTKYVDGRDFSDGVAWMRASDEQWHCVDKTGSIVLKLSEREEPKSDFSHGVALVRRSDNTVELIDKAGKVISSPKSGEYDEIRGFIHDIGMILVHRYVDTWEVTEDRAGVIDSKGDWKVTLGNDFVLTSATKMQYNSSLLHIKTEPRPHIDRSSLAVFAYLGDGIFASTKLLPDGASHRRDVDAPTFFYNIVTGKKFSTKLYQGGRFFRKNLTRIEGGYGIYSEDGFTGGPSFVCSISASGEVRQLFNLRNGTAESGDYKEGLFFYEGGDKRGFFDIQGKQIIDLKQYGLGWSDPMPEFIDGHCLLNLRNSQGVDYYTIIGKDGKFIFEPRRSQRQGLVIKCGMIVINEDNKFSVIDTTGKTVVDLGQVNGVSNFSEDAAMVISRDGIYYIDKTGKRLW